MTSPVSYWSQKEMIPLNPVWEKKIPNLKRMLPWFLRAYDPSNNVHRSDIKSYIDKNCSKEFKDWLYAHTMYGKFEYYCDKIKKQGFGKLTHEEKVWLASHVVNSGTKGKGCLHSKKNLDKLHRAGYPAHLLNSKFTAMEKVAHIIELAKQNPHKIPFDLSTQQRHRWPDGNGDMKQWLRENVIGGKYPPSKKFVNLLKEFAPDWLKEIENYKNNHTAKAKRNSVRDTAVQTLIDLAQLRPRVGAKKHGGGYNKIVIDKAHTKWFKPLAMTRPKAFAKIQKMAPWWFGYAKRNSKNIKAVCPYNGQNGAKKLDLLDYARNKKNKIYKYPLRDKHKTKEELFMKHILTYCTKSRIKNGYDKKFHLEMIKLRPEIKKLYPIQPKGHK